MKKPIIDIEKKLFFPNPFAATEQLIRRQKIMEQLAYDLNLNEIRILVQRSKESESKLNPEKVEFRCKGFLGYKNESHLPWGLKYARQGWIQTPKYERKK